MKNPCGPWTDKSPNGLISRPVSRSSSRWLKFQGDTLARRGRLKRHMRKGKAQPALRIDAA